MNFFSKRKEGGLFVNELFYFLLSLTVVSIVLEIIFPRIILAYLNINYLIIATTVTGLYLLIKE
ncbi:MAG: hypothetical protein PHH52_01600 [Patescibacteria group bacterium]|jgi:hypothetical protein|nr:hypothetical protein [Patescibacteria group bacterium]MDD3778054.1 hypothetical protein [Patescibacteria group bacterium]MDD3939377.1 hypothetical protein [Patescibacteria group bacterium]MDD4443915.1 hypothetical protein [Patescibacteria group bacterium]NCU39393.1 hypothetical protein [Candidatus Falkowbacteria bacterium]